MVVLNPFVVLTHFGEGAPARVLADVAPVDTLHTTLIPLVVNIMRAATGMGELVPHLQDIVMDMRCTSFPFPAVTSTYDLQIETGGISGNRKKLVYLTVLKRSKRIRQP